MRFLIITHVEHAKRNNGYFAYAPYVREMNLWLKHVDEVEIVAPLTNFNKSEIDLDYHHPKIHFNKIPTIKFTSFFNSIKSLFKIPIILFSIFASFRRADHVHLRCPGNIGLLGCFVQILFPNKIKTAKYAGNWDPESKQPLSYKIQKRLLSNTFLTKNMQALVYGQWKNQTKNIKDFFTATYHSNEIEPTIPRDYNKVLNFMFVGSLVDGKRPMLCVQIIERLINLDLDVKLDVFGDGVLKHTLVDYISKNDLDNKITLHGNVNKNTLKEFYKKSHFIMLPSKSEGWPKAIAEAMFFGVIAIATKVSCVSWMLDEGRRGVLIEADLEEAVNKIVKSIKNDNLESMSLASQQWSQHYTLDVFEQEIKKLLNN